VSVLPINEVRERLHNLADYAGGGSFPSLAGDLRALLEDHARLRALVDSVEQPTSHGAGVSDA